MTLSLVVRNVVSVLVLLAGLLSVLSFTSIAQASMAGDINCEIGGILDQHNLPGPSGCDNEEETSPTDLCPNDTGIQTTTPCPSDTNSGGDGENNGGTNEGNTEGNTNGGSQGDTSSNTTTVGGGAAQPNGGGIAPDVTGGGSTTSSTSTPSSGTVLGTSTVATSTETTPTIPSTTICDGQIPYLTSYMRMGQQNNAAEVMKLQTFLNLHLNLSLPVTGFFGQMTHDAVQVFQLKHSKDVLLPWVAYGLPNESTSTGYVYKTTQRMINNLACAMELPVPQLP